MKDLDILQSFYQSLDKNRTVIDDCVIAIASDGEFIEMSLSEKPYNHALLTNYMASLLKCSYFNTDFPIAAAQNLSRQGVLVLHIHRDGICLCFFPASITDIQYSLLEQALLEKDSFVYQI